MYGMMHRFRDAPDSQIGRRTAFYHCSTFDQSIQYEFLPSTYLVQSTLVIQTFDRFVVRPFFQRVSFRDQRTFIYINSIVAQPLCVPKIVRNLIEALANHFSDMCSRPPRNRNLGIKTQRNGVPNPFGPHLGDFVAPSHCAL